MPQVIYLEFHEGRCQETEELGSTTHIARNHFLWPISTFQLFDITSLSEPLKGSLRQTQELAYFKCTFSMHKVHSNNSPP